MRFVLAAIAAALLACDEPGAEPAEAIDERLGLSRDAKRELFESMRADMRAERHASDGGGRAWIEAVEDAQGRPAPLRAGERARFRLAYEAGPLGVAPGGEVAFRVSPWWEWDPPQPLDPGGPGFTRVTSPVEGLRLRHGWDGQSLAISFPERGLRPGERLEFVYGAGRELARVDRYAERGERLWFAVDGDGDGVRANIADSPLVDIAPGEPARLRVVVPSTARPGERVRVHVSLLDAFGNAGVAFTGEVRLEPVAGLELPGAISFAPEHQGHQRVDARASAPGVYRVSAAAESASLPAPLAARTNPLVVADAAPRLYWADLHGHSQLSDGTGTPEDYLRYARDVSGLDAIALTDHDHWGLAFLDENPALWEQIRAATDAFHEPGRFVTLLGYEWTSLLHGHRHVLYFGDDGRVLSAFDPRYQTPAQLWDALRGEPALTFAHHSAGGPISTNWRYRPDPELEPITEVVSAHGNSEAPDAPTPIYDPVAGNFVRDVLDDGVRLGFIGSGDSHDGHPGASHLDTPLGFGLAAISAPELTRAELRRALRERRVYATNGARIVLDVSLDGAALRIRAVAESPLERIDVVTRGAVETLPLAGELEWEGERRVAPLATGGYLYVRAIQRDGGAAWSSPFFAD